MVFLILLVSFIASFAAFPIIIPRLKRAGIVGKNMNSKKQEEIVEMGGLVIAAGFGAGIVFAIFLRTFFDLFLSVGLTSILAVLSTVLIVVIIGVFDDLISMKQWIKALIPVFAALPLMALKEGYSMMRIPFIGLIEFGIFYPLILVPLGITGAANAVNMLAGFNGLEVGMGVVAIGALAVIAYLIGETTALIILLAALGALVAALYYNWFPAKILVGDVGTLTIGAVVACAVIVGNYETAGVIIIIPYVVDFLIKAKNRFPYSFGIYRDGKLYCPDGRAVGLAQLIMKVCGGISERNLVLLLMGIEAVFGVIAILLYT
ncbi:putative undecaprenyl-phosphate N-acetylglucosaminyl 1-phosphate transferase [subsurface metagenome]